MYLSNGVYTCNIFAGNNVSEILMKNHHLFTLIIHGKVAPLFTKNI